MTFERIKNGIGMNSEHADFYLTENTNKFDEKRTATLFNMYIKLISDLGE